MSDVEKALEACREGRLDEAVRLCQHVLAADVADPKAVARLSHAMLQRGHAAEAEALAALALGKVPGQPDLLTFRGEALAKLGRRPEAIECLVQATDRRLIHPEAHALLADLLAEARDATPRFSVSVITPSIGSPFLEEAIRGVQEQTYPFVEHFIVADGPVYHERVRAMLPKSPRYPVHFLPLPFNVGAANYNGHRVYGAAPYLVNGRFVAFLDEDNWFEPEHVASLMAKIASEGLTWAYALRRIVDRQGNFVCDDDCESLGRWPTWDNPHKNLVDANCYLVRRDVAIAIGHLWYRRVPDDISPDFALCRQLLADHPHHGTSGRSTVNYRVGMRPDSVQAEYFLRGNEQARKQYGETFPWREPSLVG